MLDLTENFKLRTYPHKDLATVCSPVVEDEFGTFELEIICGKLLSSMRLFNGLGLAANQVGILKRIFVFENQAEDGIERPPDIQIPEIFINPEIVLLDDTQQRLFKEGCLSFPGCFPKIMRNEYFIMKYRDQEGNNLQLGPEICCGLFGHAFQHEIDHLNGITMFEKANGIDRNKMMSSINKLRKKK